MNITSFASFEEEDVFFAKKELIRLLFNLRESEEFALANENKIKGYVKLISEKFVNLRVKLVACISQAPN